MTGSPEYADANGNQIVPAVVAVLNALGIATAVQPGAGLPVYDGYLAPVSATWNSGSAAGASGATVAVGTAGYDGVMVSFVATGTVSGGHITFEVNDGAVWLPIKGFPLETYFSYQGYTLATGLNNGLQFDVAGCQQLRVRLDTAITGSGSVKITLNASSAPVVPGLVAGIDPTASAPPVGGGGINTAQVTVATSSILLIAARAGNGPQGAGVAGVGRVAVQFFNAGSNPVFIGATGVTATTGFQIPAGGLSPQFPSAAAFYGIATTGSNVVSVIEIF